MNQIVCQNKLFIFVAYYASQHTECHNTKTEKEDHSYNKTGSKRNTLKSHTTRNFIFKL